MIIGELRVVQELALVQLRFISELGSSWDKVGSLAYSRFCERMSNEESKMIVYSCRYSPFWGHTVNIYR